MNNIDTILQSAELPELPVEALPDERQAKILSGALQLVHQDAKKRSRRRVVRIVAAAAAAIAVLCGAAAIWHYASVSNEETVYRAKGTRILSDGTEIAHYYDFTSDSIIRINTEGRTDGTYCGVQFDWVPTALVPDSTAYLYDVIATQNPEQLDNVPESQIELAKDCVYSTNSIAQVKFTFSCLSANEIVGCDLLVVGNDPTIVKEGILNGLYACWIETYESDRGAEVTNHFLLLYDPDKLCMVFLGGDWEVTEKMAENMTIVQTDIPTPEPFRNYTFIGAFCYAAVGCLLKLLL